MPDLFETTTFGALHPANRLVMAPMSRNRANADGTPTELMATYYAQRADAGLIITEGTQPSQVAQGFMNTPGLHNAAQTTAWRDVTDAVHARGGLIAVQLMHAGRIGHPSLYPSAHQSVAPSSIPAAGTCFTPDGLMEYPEPSTLTPGEINETINDFVCASRLAIDAGFDAVEIHGGNGFLLHQFLAANTNLRNDEHGGDPKRRAKLTEQVVRAVADAIGPDRVGLRISPGNPYNDIEEGDVEQTYAALLNGVPPIAFLHVLETVDPAYTRIVRSLWAGPMIVNPRREVPAGHWDPQVAELLDTGLAQAVCVGAAFLANPDLIERIHSDGPYNTPDEATFYSGGSRGYTDYPTLSRAMAP